MVEPSDTLMSEIEKKLDMTSLILLQY
jgi:hypothetical protein